MLRTLIVDDTDTNRQLLQILLGTEDGVEIVGESHNGRDAVADAVRLAPDLIVMDGEMPIMNGPAATHAIKALDPSMMVIAYSSSDDLGDEMLAAGAFAVVPKTGEIGVLLEAVEGAKREMSQRLSLHH